MKGRAGQNPDDPLGIMRAWRSGARIVGNAEAVKAARAEWAKAQAATRYAAKCPRNCGTIVRRSKQRDADRAAREHAADPKACTRHPDR